jgi:hypothetical protein
VVITVHVLAAVRISLERPPVMAAEGMVIVPRAVLVTNLPRFETLQAPTWMEVDEWLIIASPLVAPNPSPSMST